ncbi:MAG: hypothetical protein HZB25_05445, partial [Candidatus Eisenbacteria bacterium]|nr:hypothetical protein [Candidatus Eisenbacteria bacterium]
MTVSHAHPATGPRERVALVGLGPDSLDLIHLVRERGGEVCLVADPDPGSRTHALAAVFRVPSTQELERVEESGCDLLVLPDEAFAADTWQARWNAAGLRCLTVEQAWRHFSEPEIHAPAG